ncbi:hypothetical protein CDAR_316681 [Caerostris darwini]|uniref:Uncharacterized protein n=1 Tax=Caerostris darwini TaxID=1538125 RepID=A0AAV4UK09_9ARAC|nr:hypothetical protein CDAR_316681 [Caerostris darwini]
MERSDCVVINGGGRMQMTPFHLDGSLSSTRLRAGIEGRQPNWPVTGSAPYRHSDWSSANYRLRRESVMPSSHHSGMAYAAPE